MARFMKFSISFRASSRTRSSASFSTCILIFFPVMTLLLTSGPSSPLEEEDDPSNEWERRRRFSLALCLRFSAFFFFPCLLSFFLCLPLLLDRLCFFLCFLDLLRLRSLERELLLPLSEPEEDGERDLERWRRRRLRWSSPLPERRSCPRRQESESEDGDRERPLAGLSAFLSSSVSVAIFGCHFLCSITFCLPACQPSYEADHPSAGAHRPWHTPGRRASAQHSNMTVKIATSKTCCQHGHRGIGTCLSLSTTPLTYSLHSLNLL